jgi:hypothetical protein
MAAARCTKSSKPAVQDQVKHNASSVQRRVDALSDSRQTEEEAAFVGELLARPSTLPSE